MLVVPPSSLVFGFPKDIPAHFSGIVGGHSPWRNRRKGVRAQMHSKLCCNQVNERVLTRDSVPAFSRALFLVSDAKVAVGTPLLSNDAVNSGL